MKYVVMECCLSYAVVLDEEGRFLKVANMHYEVGQTVTDVIEMRTSGQTSAGKQKKIRKWIYSAAAAAACLILVFTALFRTEQTPYASVYITINPEVRVDIDQNDTVIGLEGVNEDGKQLVDGYSYRKKQLDLVMDELVDRAIEMGYLYEGGQITLTLDAEDDEWIVSHSESLTSRLNEHLREKMSVTIEIRDTKTESHEIIIPVTPAAETYQSSDYGETQTQESSAPQTAPETSAPQTAPPTAAPEPADGDSGYGEEAAEDGQSAYAEPNDGSGSDYDDDGDDDGDDDSDDNDDDGDDGDDGDDDDDE